MQVVADDLALKMCPPGRFGKMFRQLWILEQSDLEKDRLPFLQGRQENILINGDELK
jgi:hypothetical protein